MPQSAEVSALVEEPHRYAMEDGPSSQPSPVVKKFRKGEKKAAYASKMTKKPSASQGSTQSASRGSRRLSVTTASNNRELMTALPPFTMHISKLPHDTNESELRDVFSDYGRVVGLCLRNKHGDCKTWAFVSFDSAETLANVIQAKSSGGVRMIKGGNVYILVVEFPQPRTKKGASGGLTLMLHANRAKSRWDKMSQRVVHKKSLQDIAAEVIPGSADALLIEETTQFIAEERCCFFIPGSAMLKFWQIFQAFTLVYIAFVYPIREGFDSRTTVGSKAFYVDVVVDLWFVADIFVNFRSAYRLEETKVLIVDQKEIAKRYLKGWFLIDFVSSLPLNYVLLLDNSSGDSGPRKSGAAFKWLKVARLLRLLRLTRLSRFKRTISTLGHEQPFLLNNSELLRSSMLGILMLWLTHVLCCVWYAVGDGEQINSADGSVIQGWVLHDFGSGLGTSRDLNQSTTEDYVGAVGAAGLFRRYLFAFHAVNPKMFDMHDAVHGDFTDNMIIVSVLLEVLGVLVFGVVVGTLSEMLSNGKLGDKLLNEKMDILREFFRMRSIPFDTRRRVTEFYEHKYKNSSVFDEADIIKPLPTLLGRELVYEMYKDMIQNSPVFNGMDEAACHALCAIMHPMHVPANTVIIQEGDVGHEMYIVINGEAVISQSRRRLRVLTSGAVFGQEALLGIGIGKGGVHRNASITAETVCNLCFVERSELLLVINEFPVLEEALVDHSVLPETPLGRSRSATRSGSGAGAAEIAKGQIPRISPKRALPALRGSLESQGEAAATNSADAQKFIALSSSIGELGGLLKGMEQDFSARLERMEKSSAEQAALLATLLQLCLEQGRDRVGEGKLPGSVPAPHVVGDSQ